MTLLVLTQMASVNACRTLFTSLTAGTCCAISAMPSGPFVERQHVGAKQVAQQIAEGTATPTVSVPRWLKPRRVSILGP